MSRTRGVDDGYSLVELLISIAIMGIAFAAILGALAASATATSVHRSAAEGETVLKRYAEAVEALPYTDCGTPPDYEIAGFSAAGFTVTVDEVAVWNQDQPATFRSTSLAPCVDTSVQRIDLRLTSTSGAVAERSTSVFKREP